MKARPLDPHWTTDLPSLVAYLDDLCTKLTNAETRKRSRKADAQANFEKAIKAIVLDLYRGHLSDPELEIGIAAGQGTLQKRAMSRYGIALLSPRSFRAALQSLIDHGYIMQTTPHWDDPSGKNSRTARYQATLSLLSALSDAGASFVVLSRHKEAEGIRLKDDKKRLVEYGDIRFANEARDRLRVINDMLKSHWADLALTEQQLSDELAIIAGEPDDEAAQSFDFAARTVYRVFNNNDWEQGGRFYGAWWMACPSRLRRYILINGKRTVEVDYKGMHAAMLYAKAGMPIPDDPYKRCVTKTGNDAERKLVKTTFNALLNVKSVVGLKEVEDYEANLTGRTWADFKQFIVSSFPEFKQHFGSGVGLKLQRKDSDLAESVMLEFAKMNYACLPVHDSFIVHHEMQDVLTDTMKVKFKDMFGVAGETDFDIGLGEIIEGTDEPIEVDIDELLHPCGYEGRLQAFYNKQQQN
ncbi:hypothetical protein [Roseobacter litoralis]|uniref:hypothetical protein n=1 Tax=Roseobacter litoralis TaxID=42443 RepID=UPI0024956E6B|nr:hypothetical protein [Roseobacter litoralis]